MSSFSPRTQPSYSPRCVSSPRTKLYVASSYTPRATDAVGDPTTPRAKSSWDLSVLRKQFDSFDKDGSGYLDRKEMSVLLRMLGSTMTFDAVDGPGGDAKVSFDEFSVFAAINSTVPYPVFKAGAKAKLPMQSIRAGDAHNNEALMRQAGKAWRKLAESVRASGYDEDASKACFDKIDIDQDGSLDPGEVRLAVKQLAPQLSEADVVIMLACADTDACARQRSNSEPEHPRAPRADAAGVSSVLYVAHTAREASRRRSSRR